MYVLEESSLIAAAGDLWPQATRAAFLDAIAEGQLPEEAFRRWLAQDYLFAKGLTSFQAVAAAKTPRGSQSLLIQGLVAMDHEMDWFEANAAKMRIDLSVEPHRVCRRYVDYLIAASYAQQFEVLLAILFGVEASYPVAWSRLKPEGPYAQFIERWSSQHFVEYVQGLRDLAERHPHPRQQDDFNEVLRHERDFWSMTWEG